MRLAVPRLLKDKVEHFIYLDADTLCFDKLNDIGSIDISNVICAVSHDSLDIHDTKNAKRLGLSTGHYFNAGFCILTLKTGSSLILKTKQTPCYLNKVNPCLTLTKMHSISQ